MVQAMLGPTRPNRTAVALPPSAYVAPPGDRYRDVRRGGHGCVPAGALGRACRRGSRRGRAPQGMDVSEVDVIGDDEISGGDVPDEDTILRWIAEVVDQGIRRPGCAADEWVEQWAAERFRALGMRDVRLEPVEVRRWEPAQWSLEVTAADGSTGAVDCFPRAVRSGGRGARRRAGGVRSHDARRGGRQGLARRDAAAGARQPHGHRRLAARGTTAVPLIDVESTLAGEHVLPFGIEFQEVLEPSMAAGAAFVGVLHEYRATPAATC